MPINNFILESIKNNLSDIKLNLSLNENLNDNDLFMISDALRSNNTITHLNLANNSFTRKGIVSLFNALPSTSIISINLSNCDIQVASALYIANSLSLENFKLTELNLSSNEIRRAGILALTNAINQGTSHIKHLNFEENYIIDFEACMCLHHAVSKNRRRLIQLERSPDSFVRSVYRFFCSLVGTEHKEPNDEKKGNDKCNLASIV